MSEQNYLSFSIYPGSHSLKKLECSTSISILLAEHFIFVMTVNTIVQVTFVYSNAFL